MFYHTFAHICQICDFLKLASLALMRRKKANQILGIIKKSYISRDAGTISTLYKAMVRPHLEYGNAIWGPFSQGDKKAIESVQRRATKLIDGFNDKSYEDRLKQLKLPSLGYRRKRGDMIWMFKIMNGLVRMDASKLFVRARLSQTRGHQQKVFKKHAIKLPRKNSFSQRCVNDWNTLPKFVVEAPTLDAFKNRLDNFWQQVRYDYDG